MKALRMDSSGSVPGGGGGVRWGLGPTPGDVRGHWGASRDIWGHSPFSFSPKSVRKTVKLMGPFPSFSIFSSSSSLTFVFPGGVGNTVTRPRGTGHGGQPGPGRGEVPLAMPAGALGHVPRRIKGAVPSPHTGWPWLSVPWASHRHCPLAWHRPFPSLAPHLFPPLALSLPCAWHHHHCPQLGIVAVPHTVSPTVPRLALPLSPVWHHHCLPTWPCHCPTLGTITVPPRWHCHRPGPGPCSRAAPADPAASRSPSDLPW